MVRSSAKSDGEKLGVLPSGSTVNVIELRDADETTKALIRLPDALEPWGWVSLKVGDGAKPALVSRLMVVKPSDLTKKDLVVREQPGAKSTEKSKLVSGTKLYVLEQIAAEGCTWARVALENTDMADAGWVRQIDKEGRAQLAVATEDDTKKPEGKDGKRAPAKQAETPPPPVAKTGKGAATRKAAVAKVEMTASEAVVTSSASAGIKYKRLAKVKNNMVCAPSSAPASLFSSAVAGLESIPFCSSCVPCRIRARCASGMTDLRGIIRNTRACPR